MIYGSNDRVDVEAGKRLVRSMQSAMINNQRDTEAIRYHVVPNAGYHVFLECSNAFNDIHSVISLRYILHFSDSPALARAGYIGHISYILLYPVKAFVRRPALHEKIRKQLQNGAGDGDAAHHGTKTFIVWGFGGIDAAGPRLSSAAPKRVQSDVLD